MPALVLVGAQWGDEGKGKATDLFGDRSTTLSATRAGTTPGTRWSSGTRIRAAPAALGVLSPEVTPVIGNGVVIDPEVLLQESTP